MSIIHPFEDHQPLHGSGHKTVADVAKQLADARCTRTLCDVELGRILSLLNAAEIQRSAMDAVGFDRRGYTVIGLGEPTRRALQLGNPVFCEVPTFAVNHRQSEVQLSPGSLGAQAGLVFTVLRPFPEPGEKISFEAAGDAVIGMQPCINFLSRRTSASFVGDDAATADFAFHDTTVCGDFIPLNADRMAGDFQVAVEVSARDTTIWKTQSVLARPLRAVAWLAKRLAKTGRQIQPGDLVITGSCSPIVYVEAGQCITAGFDEFEPIRTKLL